MHTRVKQWLTRSTDFLLLALLLAAPVQAQETDTERRDRFEERRVAMEQRRAEFLENNPEAAARIEQRREAMRQRREEFLANNPQVAEGSEQRRAKRLEGESRPRPGMGRGRQSGPGGARER